MNSAATSTSIPPSIREPSPWSGSRKTGARCLRATSGSTFAKKSGRRGWSETSRDSHASCPLQALYHGQVVNVSGIARDCGVARTTVQGYLDILEDTLLVFRLPAFQPRLRARERHHPKLYWVDPGLVRAMKKLHGPIAPEERGALLEGWVLHLLRAHGEEGGLFDELHYWAPHPANRTEVDFLLRRGDSLAAIEIKSQPRYNTGMLQGLRAIEELPGMVHRVLVYGGKRSFRTGDGIDVWSTDRLHQALTENVFWT